MLKIENMVAPSGEQWVMTVMGMRNPMNSWEKSDSKYDSGEFNLGKADADLMNRLIRAGTEHRKFMRMLPVHMTITAPMYWWLEFDTYKIGTVSNSCSKMHKLLSKPFELSDFSFDKVCGYKNEVKQFRPYIDEELEEWKPMPNYYSISNFGRVKNSKNKILSGSVHSDGYIFVTIKGKQTPIHRLVAETFIDNPDNLPIVNHIDGNKMNNQVSNLEWCTQSYNVKHAIGNSLQPKGLSTYKGKFSQEQREKIKKEWDETDTSKRELAKKYGVSHTCINDIINDKYKYANKINVFEEYCKPLVDTLNELRDLYLNESDTDTKKKIWYTILQLLPESYNQTRTVFMNYEVALNIIRQRKNHKLDEWHVLVGELLQLPYMEDIIDIAIFKEL